MGGRRIKDKKGNGDLKVGGKLGGDIMYYYFLISGIVLCWFASRQSMFK